MNSKIFLVALGLLTGASAAGAVTVTFEGQSNAIYNAPITRSGFDFGNVAGDEQHFHEIDSTQFGLASNGTGVLLNDRDSRIFTRASDLSSFSLTSIDVATAFSGGSATSLTIQGFLNNVLTGTVSISSLGQFQTVSGSAFGTVDYLVFDGTGGDGGFELDNAVFGAVTAAVPEPASWALMIVGFGMVGGALRRRASLATA